MRNSTKGKLVLLAGSALLFICTFLPYAKAELLGNKASTSLLKGGDGIFFIVLAVLGIILTLLDKMKPAFGVSVLAVCLAVFEVANFSKEIENSIYGSIIHRGSGFYFMIIGAIVMLAGAIIDKKNV